MAIKLLENIGIENTGIGASALNNLITGNRSGIVGNYLNECAFTATGNTIIIDKGLLIICGRQVELDAIESITLSSVPSENERYQVVIELTREETGEVTASIFARQPSTLIQENLMKDGFVYQFELGRVTHTTSGKLEDIIRTADILTSGSSGGADFEIGEVTTQMIASGLPAEVDIEKRQIENKTYIDFAFGIPKGIGSNPNLLINGDFAINQRGASSYTGANTYTVDRWQHGTSFVTASVLSKGVRLTASTSGTTEVNYFLYNQPIEDYAKYAGKTVTATLAYENNTFINGKINIRCDTTSNYSTATMSTSGVITFTLTLPSSITTSLKFIITGNHNNGTEETIDLLYAKLEIGSIATPFVPPLIAEELPKCQRYYRKTAKKMSTQMLQGAWRDTTKFRSVINGMIPMRITPTLSTSNCTVFDYSTNATIAISNYRVYGFATDSITLQFEVVSGGTSGLQGELISSPGLIGYVALDAEIY